MIKTVAIHIKTKLPNNHLKYFNQYHLDLNNIFEGLIVLQVIS